MHSTAVPVSLCLSPLQIFNSFSHRQSASVALAQQFLSSLTSALRAASHICVIEICSSGPRFSLAASSMSLAPKMATLSFASRSRSAKRAKAARSVNF